MNGKSVQSQQLLKWSLLVAAILCCSTFATAADDDSSASVFVPPAPTGEELQLTAFEPEPTPATAEMPTYGDSYQQALQGAPGCCDACDGSCQCSTPCFDFSTSYLLLKQERSIDRTLTTFGGNELFNSDQFDLDYSSGIEYELGLRLNDNWRIAGRYFRVFETSANERFLAPVGAHVFNTTPTSTSSTISNTLLDAALESEFRSAELNLEHRASDRVTFLLGFRHLSLDDRFLVNQFGSSLAVFNWETENDLYGGQIGADILLYGNERTKLNLISKFGVFNNNADGEFRANGLGFNSFAKESDDTTSTMVDLQLQSACQLTDHCSLLLGYRVLFVNKVAFATEQIKQTSNFNSTGRESMPLSIDDELFLHGFNAGLEITY